MIPETTLKTLSSRIAHFLAIVESVEGVEFNSLCLDVTVRSKKCPDLMAITMEGNDIILQYIDMEHTISGEKNAVSVQQVHDAIRKYIEMKQKDTFIADLVDTIAKDGGVFVNSIDTEDLICLQSIWSDAYGEDRLEVFMHPINKNTHRGYIRSNLSPQEIKARQNEDGPDFNCSPLFPDAVPVGRMNK